AVKGSELPRRCDPENQARIVGAPASAGAIKIAVRAQHQSSRIPAVWGDSVKGVKDRQVAGGRHFVNDAEDTIEPVAGGAVVIAVIALDGWGIRRQTFRVAVETVHRSEHTSRSDLEHCPETGGAADGGGAVQVSVRTQRQARCWGKLHHFRS